MNAPGLQSYKMIWIISFFLIAGTVFLACNRSPSPNQPPSQQAPKSQIQTPNPPITPMGEPSGMLVYASGCKETTGVPKMDMPRNMDCVEWTYDPAGVLLLTHINSGFNCCPDSVFSDITINDATIHIQEYEKDGLCDCLCLFDLEYRFENIAPSIWTIRFQGLYGMPEDPPLEQVINLADSSEGLFCIQRDYYPWGIY